MKKTLIALVFALAGSSAGSQPIDLSTVPAQPSALTLPKHWHHGAFMEVFVRAYQDSNGDGVGDLRGLISRLDYLRDLGVKGLWLMPIQTNADGDHGYATVDFRAIAPEYGTLDDFDTLLREAAQRGIGVIIDYAVNHSSSAHPLFMQARADAKSPWRDWYVFSDRAPAGWFIWDKNPWYANTAAMWDYKGAAKALPPQPAEAADYYFGTFGPQMPDFNLRNPAVVDYHLSSLRFWLNRGLAGYRLDAVPHLIENSAKDWNDQPESRALTHRLVEAIHAYPERFVICEATAKPQAYGDDKVCGGAFAFGYTQHFVKAANGNAASVRELARYYRKASPNMATFVSNHDKFAGRRLWDQVHGDSARYKLAAAGYLLQPGTPFIYYGEEVGQAGATGPDLDDDQQIRSPMSWTRDGGFSTATPFRPVAPNAAMQNAQSQAQDHASIHAFYKAMLALRNTRASIARGSFEHSFADGLVLGFQRRLGRERTLVLINYGSRPARVVVPGLRPGAAMPRLYPMTTTRARVAAAGPLVLPPKSVRVYDVGR